MAKVSYGEVGTEAPWPNASRFADGDSAKVEFSRLRPSLLAWGLQSVRTSELQTLSLLSLLHKKITSRREAIETRTKSEIDRRVDNIVDKKQGL